MGYPVWHVVFGPQLLIAVIAVVHVFISQFAVGGGLFLVLYEGHAARHNDLPLREWLERYTGFFAFLTLCFGATTGVGIWFTISLISPGATETLIHIFLWVWAIEWLFFLVEVVSIIVYLKTWNTISSRSHRAIGWIYFVSAYLSLVAINGILSFQLTPGRWLKSGSLADAYFNPGFVSTTLVRSSIAVVLAGLYALTAVSFSKDRILRREVASYAGRWVWIGAVLLLASGYYAYFSLPGNTRALFTIFPSLHLPLGVFLVADTLLFIFGIVVGLRRYITLNKGFAILMLVAGFCVVGAFEFTREDLRKPYLINGYLYANHIRVSAQKECRDKGLLKSSPFLPDVEITPINQSAVGKAIFNAACSSCHSVRVGLHAIAPKLVGLDEAYLSKFVFNSDLTRYRMPPFPGTAEEAAAVASYLVYLSPPGAPGASGKDIWKRRCAQCHDLYGAFRPVGESFKGLDTGEAEEIIDSLNTLDERMPPWTGTAKQSTALASYLVSGKEGAR